ncbi:hypothetical protein PENTCL1PPCAC_5735, partial [Pristionchus entomophagus]
FSPHFSSFPRSGVIMESVSLVRTVLERMEQATQSQPQPQPAVSTASSHSLPLQPQPVQRPAAAEATAMKRSAEKIKPAEPVVAAPAAVAKSKFDFALVCRKSRVAQLTALTVQMYMIHSEYDRIGNFHFVLLFVALATHGVNIFMRWRDSIDGRFDLKQIYDCSSHNLRVQYALAVLTGPLLSLFTYWCLIPQKIKLVNASLYSIAAFVKLLFACGCFLLEVIEVN